LILNKKDGEREQSMHVGRGRSVEDKGLEVDLEDDLDLDANEDDPHHIIMLEGNVN